MGIVKNFIKSPAIGIFIGLILILSSTSSWGDTRVRLSLTAADGQTTASGMDATYLNMATIVDQDPQQLNYSGGSCLQTTCPLISCDTPSVQWDASAKGWVVIGNDDSGNLWSGLITCPTYPPTTDNVSSCSFTYKSGTPPASCASAPISNIWAVLSDGAPDTIICTSFVYSDWGACQADGTQTRTVVSGSPSGCTGGTPVTSQSCTYVPPCTSFGYSAWGACQPNGTQTRTVVSTTPSVCTGGTPITSQSCTYVPPTCTSFTYSDWGACQSNGTQTRTVSSSSPSGCTGGTPITSQSCTYVTTCTSFTYTAWGSCQPDGTQTRTVSSSSPSGCTGGTPVTSQSCTYTGVSVTSMNFGPGGSLAGQILVGGQERIYSFTVPATNPSGAPMSWIHLGIASQTQNTNLNMILQQGTADNIDSNYSSVMSCPVYLKYGQNGQTCLLTPPTTNTLVRANITGSTGGQDIYVYQSTANPPTNLGTSVALLPGVYYVLVKNTGTATNTFGIAVSGG